MLAAGRRRPAGGGGFPAVQQHRKPGRRCRRLQGRRRLDHRGLVEFAGAHLRDGAQGKSRRPLLLCLRHRLRSRRRMDGPSLHVHPRQGIHHPRHQRLPGARLRPHRLLRGRYRRAARLDRAAYGIERPGAAASAARRQSAGSSFSASRNAAPVRPPCGAQCSARQAKADEATAPHQSGGDARAGLFKPQRHRPAVRGRRRRISHQHEPHQPREDARARGDDPRRRRPNGTGRSASWSILQGPKLRLGSFQNDSAEIDSGQDFCSRRRSGAGRCHARSSAASGNLRRDQARRHAADRRRQTAPRRYRRRTAAHRRPRQGRRQNLEPQGRQPARYRHPGRGAGGKGYRRSRSRARCRHRLGGAVVHPAAGGYRRSQEDHPRPRGGDGQDREAAGGVPARRIFSISPTR